MNAGRLVLATVVGALVLAAGAMSMPTPAAPIFRVRPDLRMCPSPMCGGYWVAQANRATTRCGDGTALVWCYVAGMTSPKPVAARSELLARGRIVRGGNEARPADRFVATATWLAATRAASTGAVYLVSDNGIRCVRAPCFTLRVATVNTSRITTASGLDLAGVKAGASFLRKARTATTRGGLLVAGTIRRDADGGRTVVATQFFLATS